MNVLEVKHVEKTYGDRANLTKALRGISFDIAQGEFVAIMGASGSGKTTLLNCISTIDHVSSGSILLNGKDITKLPERELARFRREELGFIFQDFNLLDPLNAFDNIALALSLNRMPARKIRQNVEQVAKQLLIEDLLQKYPYQLSGGEKQRVAAARALITDPSLILADEPTGALDSRSARRLLETLERLHKDLGSTILMVSHDPFAASYADRILFIKDGQLFSELRRGHDSRSVFFEQIMQVVTLLGGEAEHVD